MLNPSSRSDFPGNSRVSSTVITLYFLIISTSNDPKKDVFPELLVPQTRSVRVPSIKKLIKPAASAVSIFCLINKGRVHGFSLCLLNENASPVGSNGFVITETLVDAQGSSNSVSRIGSASSNGLPEIIRSFVAQLSASALVGIIFVVHSL